MAKTRKKLTREEKLAKDRLRKREKYMQIKNDPELYSIQKEKERTRYLARKAKKKICSIHEMTPRAQREQRKRWRKNSQNYLKKKAEQKKIEKILIENSPPDTDPENNISANPPRPDPLILDRPGPSSNHNAAAKLPKFNNTIRRMRYNHMKTVKKLKDEINKLKREKDALRKQNNTARQVIDSTEKKIEEVLVNIRPEKKEEVKKQLLFSETITKNLQDSYKTVTKKNKRHFTGMVIKNEENFRKYKLLHKLPFIRRKKNTKEKKETLINQIHGFFEEDANSRVAAGKKEFVRKGGIKKQKRYLNDNLKNLHKKFLKEQCNISYSTFCKYRPYWVVFPNSDRDTCQCKLHSNVNLLIKALNTAEIITDRSGTDVIKSLCCDLREKCLERTCSTCVSKVLNYHEFNNSKKINYYQWVVEKKPYTVKNGTQHFKIVSIKKRFEDYPRDVIYKLESMLAIFLKHNLNITVQYEVIKELKQHLKENEILVHIDFSENYCLKYNQEIQSFHFGGSREQVSLDTGILYYKNNKEQGTFLTKAFCTMSDCLKHDSVAIWAHLCPILKMAYELVPFNIVHFLSDSPSSQYRNKNTFFIITKLKDTIPGITKVTWNYQESGHGKGAPDGVGAAVKRAADEFVRYGGDVGSYEDFTTLITKKVQNIHFEIITENDIMQKEIPSNVPGFKGTMQVHQIIWTSDHSKIIALRRLSCFKCHNSSIPCEHNKHLGFLQFNDYGDAQIDEPGLQCDSTDVPDVIDDQSMNIDTSMILNNLYRYDNFDNLKPLSGPIDLQLSPMANLLSTSSQKSSPKVKILSDVRLSWENCKFYGTNQKLNLKKPDLCNSDHQLQFEAFVQANKENKNFDCFESDDSGEFNIF